MNLLCSFFLTVSVWRKLSESPVTLLVHIFWCLVFLLPTCVLVLSSPNGNQEPEWHVHIMNPKQFPDAQFTYAFRENQNSNSTILKLALGMGGAVSLTVSDVNEDWQMTIWFFLAFVVGILSHSLSKGDTKINSISNTDRNLTCCMDCLNKTSLTAQRTWSEALVQMNSSTLAFTKEAWKTMALDLVKVFNWTLQWSFRIKCPAKIDIVGASVLD